MSEYQVAPAHLSYATIQGVAEELSKSYRQKQGNDSLAVDLNAVLRDIDGDIEYGVGAESSFIDDKKQFHIYLPNMTSPRRDRFTIAHELGHYFFHYVYPQFHNMKPSKKFGRGGHNRAETQANVFASAFLMPKSLFTKVFAEKKGDLQSVADAFLVSVPAASVRAQILNLGD
ncbi:MAG: ImmA/IrrE family metallo-endopeptidase [Lactobacillus sp.]|nr:ImmA/IrrE family metallo-endopeptidase [Lactobacillus sp.]